MPSVCLYPMHLNFMFFPMMNHFTTCTPYQIRIFPYKYRSIEFYFSDLRLLISRPIREFLLLARYVPNDSKRSIMRSVTYQCKKKYIIILSTDRPTDRRPMTERLHIWPILGKFQMAISPRGVVRSTSCLVLRWGFRGQRIEWR